MGFSHSARSERELLIERVMSNLEDKIAAQVRAEVRAILPDLLAEYATGNDAEFIDTKKAAELTGLSKQFFECGRSKGDPNQPRWIKVGRRVLYSRSELIAWMRHRTEAQS
ncbi:MAG: helix-turn-helix transcriptional regulator [Parvularculaceae bacterium]